MWQHRHKNVPEMPRTVEQLSDRVHLFAPIAKYYRGSCVAGDSRAVIFITPTMLQALKEAKALIGDGTFKVG